MNLTKEEIQLIIECLRYSDNSGYIRQLDVIENIIKKLESYK